METTEKQILVNSVITCKTCLRERKQHFKTGQCSVCYNRDHQYKTICIRCNKEGIKGTSSGLCVPCYKHDYHLGKRIRDIVKAPKEPAACKTCNKVKILNSFMDCNACYKRQLYRKNNPVKIKPVKTPELPGQHITSTDGESVTDQMKTMSVKEKIACSFCLRLVPRITVGLCAACYSRKNRNGSPEIRKTRGFGSGVKTKKEIKKKLSIEKKGKHYLSDMDLYKELVVSLAMGKISTKAVHMFHLIAKKLVNKWSYYDYDMKNDAISACVLRLLEVWMSFNPEKGTAFPWCTEVAKREIVRNWMLFNEVKQGGGRIQTISLEGMNSDGENYNRF